MLAAFHSKDHYKQQLVVCFIGSEFGHWKSFYFFFLCTSDLLKNAQGQTKKYTQTRESTTAQHVRIHTNSREMLKHIPSLKQWSQSMCIQNYLRCNSCHLRCAFRNWPWRPRGPWGSRRPWGSRQITCRWLAGNVRFCTTGKGKLETWALTTWKVSFQKNFLFFALFYWREKNTHTKKQK